MTSGPKLACMGPHLHRQKLGIHDGGGQGRHRVPAVHQAVGGAHYAVEGMPEHAVAYAWAPKRDAPDIGLAPLQRCPCCACRRPGTLHLMACHALHNVQQQVSQACLPGEINTALLPQATSMQQVQPVKIESDIACQAGHHGDIIGPCCILSSCTLGRGLQSCSCSIE